MTRPLQLGLIDGADDRPVGPLVTSVIHGSNADLVHAVAPLYLAGSVLDVTYGRGGWWRRYQPATFRGHDLATDGVDFRELPYSDRSWDAVCFDPPYLPQGRGTDPRGAEFRDRYGLAEVQTGGLGELVREGIAECSRVARTWLLVKCCDYVNGSRLNLGHLDVIGHAQDAGLYVHDLLVHAAGTGPGARILTPRRARRAHSYLLVFSRQKYDR